MISRISQSLPPRMSDRLEDIYNEEATQYRYEKDMQKRLYCKIAEVQDQKNREKRSIEKQMNKMENQQIDYFWKKQEERRREMERKRKECIDEARRVNNHSHQQGVSKSFVDPYTVNTNYQRDWDEYEVQQNKIKVQKERFLNDAQNLADIKRLKDKQEKMLEYTIAKQKQQESNQHMKKRNQELLRWKQKHFDEHHEENMQVYEQTMKNRLKNQQKLDDYIVNKGAIELNQRVAAMRMQEIEEQQRRKNEHIKKLYEQVEENTYKSAIDKYLEVNFEKQKLNEFNKYLDEREKEKDVRKKEDDKKHLQVLKSQVKPRNLIPEKDKIEFAGIGSPAHIGKIVHDDRRRQLKWIERNLYNQLGKV